MKLLERDNTVDTEGSKPRKNSRISKKFIIIIAAIYSLLIIVTSFAFHYTMKENSDILEEILLDSNREILLEKTNFIIEKVYAQKKITLRTTRKLLKQLCMENKGFLSVLIYSRTSDENFFFVNSIIPVNKNMNSELKKRAVVKEIKDINYLKKGYYTRSVESRVYSRNSLSWQNVYYPLIVKKKRYVLHFKMSAANISRALINYTESTKNIRLFMTILTIILVTAVLILTVLIIHNFLLLIKNLTFSLKKAARGDLSVSLNSGVQNELNELALSFNSLIEELKDKTEKSLVRYSEDTVEESFGDIFKMGVSMLKENKLGECIAIFKTLTIIKPDGFSSFFNLGVAYAKVKDYNNSLAMFEKALEADPAHEQTLQYIERVKSLVSPII
ncbi:MAG: hypothetical protein GY754_31630 [bacterium]|nr:hypothetical protein [bacterium]